MKENNDTLDAYYVARETYYKALECRNAADKNLKRAYGRGWLFKKLVKFFVWGYWDKLYEPIWNNLYSYGHSIYLYIEATNAYVKANPIRNKKVTDRLENAKDVMNNARGQGFYNGAALGTKESAESYEKYENAVVDFFKQGQVYVASHLAE